MRRFAVFASLVAVPALLFAACGDEAPEGGGSDDDYIRAICVGTSEYADAIVSKTTAEEIAAVTRQFITEMRSLNPPADLRDYNDDFIEYLQGGLDDPTSLLTVSPPEPPDEPRRRLAALEPTITECKEATFFTRLGEE